MRFSRQIFAALVLAVFASFIDCRARAAAAGADDGETLRDSDNLKWQYDPCAQERLMRWHGAVVPPCELRELLRLAKNLLLKLMGWMKGEELVTPEGQQSGTGGSGAARFPWAGEGMTQATIMDALEAGSLPTVLRWGLSSTPSPESIAGRSPTSSGKIPDTSADTAVSSTFHVPVPDMNGDGNPETAVYLGCYKLEGHRPGELIGLYDVVDRSLTPRTCVESCRATDSTPFAAIAMGSICDCIPYKDMDFSIFELGGTCDAPCTGDATLTCGGWMALDLYQLVPAEAKEGVHGERHSADNVRQPMAHYYQYEGCFEIGERDGDGDNTDNVFWSLQMTPTDCWTVCIKKTEFRPSYFALQGNACLCGNLKFVGEQRGVCRVRCSGDPSLECGGVYSYGLFQLLENHT